MRFLLFPLVFAKGGAIRKPRQNGWVEEWVCLDFQTHRTPNKSGHGISSASEPHIFLDDGRWLNLGYPHCGFQCGYPSFILFSPKCMAARLKSRRRRKKSLIKALFSRKFETPYVVSYGNELI